MGQAWVGCRKAGSAKIRTQIGRLRGSVGEVGLGRMGKYVGVLRSWRVQESGRQWFGSVGVQEKCRAGVRERGGAVVWERGSAGVRECGSGEVEGTGWRDGWMVEDGR